MLDRTADPTEARDVAAGRDVTTLVASTTNGLAVQDSEIHGRGVFATRRFRTGEVIEVCPVIRLPADDIGHLEETALRGYCYEWNDGGLAMAQGYGSLYNHSWAPNAQYEQDYDRGTVVITAVRTIRAGQEITINYTGAPDGRAELWFDTDAPPD